MTTTGLFITLEGGDGAGKTTQANLLRDWLTARGHTVTQTREPGGTSLGASIRELLLHTDAAIDPRAESLLYAADRAQHIAEIVRPALERGEIVVQDRYIDSSLAYQASGRVLNENDIRRISEWATEKLSPTLTILLDVSPETATVRRDATGRPADRLEREAVEFHENVRASFLRLASQSAERYLVLDARDRVAAIHEAITERVASLL